MYKKCQNDTLSLCPPDIKSTYRNMYVDDDIVAEVVKQENITSFTNFLNQQDPKIQFTEETQGENNSQHLPGLDTDICQLEDGSSKFKVY